MIDNTEIEETEEMNESLASFIRLGTLISLLVVPGILEADDLKSAKTVAEIQKVVSSGEKLYSGYTAIQVSNILARTLYYEARSEGKTGIDAVASVILNRAGGNPSNYPDVCFRKNQFSCWNDRSNLTADKYKVIIPKETLTAPKDREMWNYCKLIAGKMIFKEFKSTIGNKNAYHTTKVTPSWDKFLTDKETIGNHVFGYLQEYDANRKIYTIKQGDTLSKIAIAHNTSVDKIMDANGGRLVPTRLKIGSKIVIPS